MTPRTTFVIHYRSKTEDPVKDVYLQLKPVIHTWITEYKKDWLDNFILNLEGIVKLDENDKDNLRLTGSQKDRFIKLTEIIDTRNQFCDDDKLLKNVLNCIINVSLNNRGETSHTEELRQIICTDYFHLVEIEKTEEEEREGQGAITVKSRCCKVLVYILAAMCPVAFVASVFLLGFVFVASTPPGNPTNVTTTSDLDVFNSTSGVTKLPNTTSNDKIIMNSTENITESSALPTLISPLSVSERKPANNLRTDSHKTLFKFKMTTYEEYKFAMINPPKNRHFIVYIDLNNPHKWQRYDEMYNAEKINKLFIGGKFTLDTLLGVLNQTKKIEELVLTNRGGEICSRNKGQLSILRMFEKHDNVKLPHVHSLSLQDIPQDCTEVIEAFANHITFNNLTRFKLRSSVVNNENREQLEHLLETNRGTLKSVTLSLTAWATPVASRNPDALVNVDTFKIDFIPYANYQGNYLGEDFGRVFPNIQQFLSSAGYLPLNQIPDILQLKRLQNLQIGIEVPKGTDQFDVSFLQNFPDMVKAEIFLEFQDCRTGNRKTLVGLQTLSYKLRSLVVRSNCRLFTPGEKLDQRVEKTREKGCLYESTVENITEY